MRRIGEVLEPLDTPVEAAENAGCTQHDVCVPGRHIEPTRQRQRPRHAHEEDRENERPREHERSEDDGAEPQGARSLRADGGLLRRDDQPGKRDRSATPENSSRT